MNIQIEHWTRESAEATLRLFHECGLTALCIRHYIHGTVVSTGDESWEDEMVVDFSRPTDESWMIQSITPAGGWTGSREDYNGRCHYEAACIIAGQIGPRIQGTPEASALVRELATQLLPIDPAVYEQPTGDSAASLYRRTTAWGRARAKEHQQHDG